MDEIKADNSVKEELSQSDVSIVKKMDKWEDIGYHRVLGGFFYNIIFAVLLLAYSFLLPILLPYAESLGYYNILTGIFSSVFTFADFGLASAMSRFIPEYRVKDPARAIKYVRFFIWFQAFTGLLQTTVVSLIGLYGLKNSDLSFMPWMFVWLSIVQYPGWLGVFVEALKSFQQYGKVALIGLLNTIIFQTITLVLGAKLGQIIGAANPQIGEVMGTAIGLVIGYYVDDFTTVIISGIMFAKVMKPMGFTMRDVFTPRFEKEIAFESIKFGLGVMIFGITAQVVGTILALLYASNLPNYSTYIGTISILSPILGMAEQVNLMHIGNHRSTVSEPYFNDKKNYAQYILSNGFRTIGQVSFLMLPIVLLLGPVAVEELFPQYTNLFYTIFAWNLIFSTIFQHSHLMNEVLIGTGNNKFNILVTMGEQLISLIAGIICIKLELGIYVLLIPGFFQTAFKQGFGWWYINKKIIHLRINVWQNWVSTFLAGLVFYGLLSVFYLAIEALLADIITIFGVLAITFISGVYILPGPCYFFFVALFGGYDDNTLTDLKKAVELAGPSKIVVRLWYKFAKYGSKISRLHNKFPMDYSNVGQEIEELMVMKKNADEKNKVTVQ